VEVDWPFQPVNLGTVVTGKPVADPWKRAYSRRSRIFGLSGNPLVKVAEQEGLEPPTRFRAAAFKAVSSSSQVCSTAAIIQFY